MRVTIINASNQNAEIRSWKHLLALLFWFLNFRFLVVYMIISILFKLKQYFKDLHLILPKWTDKLCNASNQDFFPLYHWKYFLANHVSN